MLNITLPEDQVDLSTLWAGHRAIAMEGFAQSFASLTVVQNLRTQFNTSKNFIGTFFKNRDVSVYPKVADIYETVLEQHEYKDLIGYRAYVPAGLNAKFSDYVVALSGAMDTTVPNILPDLAKLTTLCAKAINDTDYRQSIGFSKELPKVDPLNQLDTLRKMFVKGGATQTTVGKAYKNDADIHQVYRLLNQTRERAVEVNPKDVRKAVERFVEVADALTDKLVKDYDAGVISNAIIRDISDAIYQAAREAEFYAFLVNGLAEVITAWNDTWQGIKNKAL